jgi:carbon storage regulator CsrA
MLVLSRKNGESVCIDADIEVKVLEICGGRVKLGFSAPSNVEIQRGEISGGPPRCAETWSDHKAVGDLCCQS